MATAHSSLLVSCLLLGLTACTTSSAPDKDRPISERGLSQIDKLNRSELNKALTAAILRNPDLRASASFAAACYLDLAAERTARRNAHLNMASIDKDIVEAARARNALALATYPTSRYWVRRKIEGHMAPITFDRENLSAFQTRIEMPPNSLLQDFSDVNPVEKRWKQETKMLQRPNSVATTSQLLVRYGPLVQEAASDRFKRCYIVFDVPKLNLSISVNKNLYQERLYESAKAGKDLEFTAEVDIEYDFSNCRLENCTPKVSDQNIRSFRFGWDPR